MDAYTIRNIMWNTQVVGKFWRLFDTFADILLPDPELVSNMFNDHVVRKILAPIWTSLSKKYPILKKYTFRNLHLYDHVVRKILAPIIWTIVSLNYPIWKKYTFRNLQCTCSGKISLTFGVIVW